MRKITQINHILLGLAILGLSSIGFSSEAKLKNVGSAHKTLTACDPAPDGEYTKLCDRFITAAGYSQCIVTGENKYFEMCALTYCHGFTTEPGAIRCLELTRNKNFEKEAVNTCQTTSTTEPMALNCIATTGMPVVNPVKEETLTRINAAMDQILNDEPIKAYNTLKSLREYVEQN